MPCSIEMKYRCLANTQNSGFLSRVIVFTFLVILIVLAFHCIALLIMNHHRYHHIPLNCPRRLAYATPIPQGWRSASVLRMKTVFSGTKRKRGSWQKMSRKFWPLSSHPIPCGVYLRREDGGVSRWFRLGPRRRRRCNNNNAPKVRIGRLARDIHVTQVSTTASMDWARGNLC